jgi:hypothetical protein
MDAKFPLSAIPADDAAALLRETVISAVPVNERAYDVARRLKRESTDSVQCA